MYQDLLDDTNQVKINSHGFFFDYYIKSVFFYLAFKKNGK
jgi:hypothetical protein